MPVLSTAAITPPLWKPRTDKKRRTNRRTLNNQIEKERKRKRRTKRKEDKHDKDGKEDKKAAAIKLQLRGGCALKSLKCN